MRAWIIALLDPEPIAKGTHDPAKRIATPPRFVMKETPSATNGASFPPPESASTRRRTLRSASPSKAPPTPSGRKIATPRKTRRPRGALATSSLATSMESTEESSHVPDAASVEPESVNGDTFPISAPQTPKSSSRLQDSIEEEVIKVDIESTTEPALDGGEATVTTHVTVETPANHPDLQLPADAQAYLDQAKAAIREANKLTAGRAAGKKRKAMEMLEDELEEVEAVVSDAGVSEEVIEQPSAKRVRLTEMELRKEKIKRRATLGIAASLAVG